MQRLLSLGTLGVMGWLGWMFLQGGGLAGIAVAPRGGQQPNSQQAGYRTPGPWDASANQQPHQRTPFSSGESAPPQNVTAGPSIRVASFNIQDFGNTKAGKPRVMLELAKIVNMFDVVAIQEVVSQDEYFIPNFVRQVNQFGAQNGRRYDHIIGPREGITTAKEQYVYLYDTTKVEVDHQSVYTLSDPDGLLARDPLVATFRTRVDPDQAFTFTLVNMHTDPVVAQQEMDVLAEVYKVVRRSSRGEDDIILLGDFNVDDRHLGRLGQIPGIFPLIAGVSTNTRQNAQYDNIIIHQPSTTEYAGRSGVFDFIRNGNLTMEQGLLVSDHFPVWAEFSIYERDGSGRVASRRSLNGR